MTEGKLLYKIFVTGHVQGVGYRWSAVNEAKSRGITGFVKNLSDGSVYIEAVGAPGQLDAFVEWCREGTFRGYVRSVHSETASPVNYTDFRIEY